MPELEILPWRRTQVLAVQVHPSGRHSLKREGLDGSVYVRVGSTNRRADRTLVGEVRRFARGEAFDEQPMPGLDSEALDFRAASESFEPVRKPARSDLKSLRLVTAHQRRKLLTVCVSMERVGPPALDETDQAIIARLAGSQGLLTSEIAKAIDLTPRATRTRLARLVGRGLVREVGSDPQDPKRRYFRAE